MFRCLVILFFLFVGNVSAQFYNLGQNPSSTRWKQINTSNFQLIFPSDFEGKAQELANIINYANEKSRLTLKTKKRKISIILQNNTTVDNGFVTLAPKRSEFYATPSQENEGVDWLKKLAVHEYRHVIQFEKYNEGVGKLLYFLFGEQGVGALLLATTPLWYLEGDAVYIETEHTERGRGDFSMFTREFIAQISELDSISYEKTAFGSFKQNITDHYKFGYYMRECLGDSVWDELTTRLVRNPFVPYPFSYHLKKLTGLSTSKLYAKLYSDFKTVIHEKNGFDEVTPIELMSSKCDNYVSYENPIYINDSLIIGLKKNFNQPDRIVAVSEGKESIIHIPGRLDDNTLNYKNGMLIWAQKRSHPRWEYLDYSEVVLFDLNKKKKRRLKRKTRWFAPDFNPMGDNVVCIEIGKDNAYSLVVSNLKGEEEFRHWFKKGEQVYQPNWYDSSKVMLVVMKAGVSKLVDFDIAYSESKELFSYSSPISYPKPFEGGVLFQSMHNGKDFVLYWKDSKIYEVVNPEFGLDFISVDSTNNRIYYSDYHSQGSRIVRSEIEIRNKIKNEWSINGEELKVKNDTFTVKPFRPLLHLFNFHSWAPLSINPNDENANLGASLFSQNLLGSSTLSLNYDYFFYTGADKHSFRYDFEHFYPKFFFTAYQEQEPNSKVQGVDAFIKTLSYQTGSELSYYFDGSRYRKNLLFRGTYVNSELKYDFEEGYVDTVINQENTQWVGAFAISHKTGRRDIYSPLSLVATSGYYFDIKEGENAQVVNLTATIPGIRKNDGVKMSVGRQWGTSLFVPNYLIGPRGVLNQTFKNGDRFSFEYGLPLLYPDLKVSRLLYIQRVRMDAFYDFMQVNDGVGWQQLSSQGGTIYFDFNPVRYSYLTTLALQLGVDREGALFFGPSFSISY